MIVEDGDGDRRGGTLVQHLVAETIVEPVHELSIGRMAVLCIISAKKGAKRAAKSSVVNVFSPTLIRVLVL